MIHDQLRDWTRIEIERHPSPSEAVIDSQSVKSARKWYYAHNKPRATPVLKKRWVVAQNFSNTLLAHGVTTV